MVDLGTKGVFGRRCRGKRGKDMHMSRGNVVSERWRKARPRHTGWQVASVVGSRELARVRCVLLAVRA